eukprot:CAMPEP_0202818210 /NCGR_PEP_ID=MMETSP1389-20130828/8170_1 /ASSEMBLY_ACC=CAM_ASM_000865 /TAXON_ID=302021 /ORGANISM="Rhodomonas sp., Strain CCMP768" /LENGTH=43 /DNA_ID= /DNA_START= /DNA_END= /DNA_ORIENTATION=
MTEPQAWQLKCVTSCRTQTKATRNRARGRSRTGLQVRGSALDR